MPRRVTGTAGGPSPARSPLGVSERTLHLDVLDEASMPPKLLARVLRFPHAVSLLRSTTAEPGRSG